MEKEYVSRIPSGQSSPGILQSGQLASNGILHMPQLSSFAIHRQVATPVQPEERNMPHVGLHAYAFTVENNATNEQDLCRDITNEINRFDTRRVNRAELHAIERMARKISVSLEVLTFYRYLHLEVDLLADKHDANGFSVNSPTIWLRRESVRKKHRFLYRDRTTDWPQLTEENTELLNRAAPS